jgi:uncharacterized protein
MFRILLCGLLLAGFSTAASAQATDLVISEYIEGSSNNKALEFYNGTGASINLATDQYQVEFYFNGSSTAGLTIALTGSVASDDVYVLANSSAVAAVTGVADQTAGGGWFNGDDAIVLRKGGAAGPIVDVIGQVGFDPGSEWGAGLVSTQDNTIVRNANVCAGDTNPADAFDPATEWTGFANDTFAGLGAHTASCSAAATDLFISEYIEGSSNNKALEIYNGTAASINLATDQYQVEFYFNGSSTAGLTIGLTGSVASDDVYVVANSSAVAAVTGVADQTAGGGWFNGDDAIVLRKGGAAGPIVDVIGQVGFDPGSEWGAGLVSTQDNTIVRIPSVCAGDTIENDAFDPATEWTGFANDTFTNLGAHTATCLGGGAGLSIDDVSQIETDAGTTIFSFTVSLSAPAGAGGVSFDIATADDTATAGTDYVARSLLAQTIAAGNSTYTFDVTVNGDTTVEPDETFFVNVTNVTGATVGDGQGLGTILNDDVVLTPIHDIQGPGVSSPIVGSTVTTRGIVTGRKSNGFFMQEPDASIDADPLTSEGIFVFTSSAPPAAAAVGNLVQVAATVVEFVPGSDPFQPPLTELSFATVVQISAGNPLPAPIALTTTFPDPAGLFDQLERLEGMRVSVASLTVNAATAGNVNETNATGSNNGVFHGVVTGVPRSLREAGIQPPDPTPAGTIPPIPRWDGNPELIRVDSDGLVGQPQLTVAAGQTVSGLIGPLDYGFRRYTILPELGSIPTAAGAATSVAVSAPLPTEVTVASYNLQRFFDDVNDPLISEPVLTAVAYANRLNKASLGIRNELQTPDIVGVVEVENLSTLQALATKINNDAVANTQPDPMYVAYLIEGNDVGGIDVGFLVKTAPVNGPLPRVTVNAVVQELAGTLFVNPDTSTVLLNDRPPLRLDAVVNNATGQTYPLTVIVNHLRSLSGATDTAAGPNGWTTDGERIRAKRQAQAEDLAVLVQNRQAGNPNEQIVLIGDFNAFEFNDGLGDSMNTITGTPTPDNQTAVTGDGADLVNPDLDNLFDTVAADERYSFVFDGVAQSLDHALVNAAVLSATTTPRIEHARMNAGFPEVDRNDPMTARRLSDHDPLVVYLAPNGFVPIDISIDKVVNGDPVVAGTQIDYTIEIENFGPQAALNSVWTDTLPPGTRFASLSSVAGWTCTTPAVGATGTVSCSNASVAVGSSIFTLVISVDANVAAGTVVSNNASVSTGSPDTNPMNNSSTAQFTVVAESDMSITLTDTPDPVTAGTNLTYTATVTNGGPSDATGVTITLPVPANTSFVSGTVSGGGSCSGAPVVCTVTGSIAPAGSRTATITMLVAASAANGSSISATATVATASIDNNAANNSASTTTLVAADANLELSLSASSLEVLINEPVTFTAVSLNLGPSDAQNLSITMTLTPDFRYTAHTAVGATCTTPQVGTSGSVTCTWAGATAPNVSRTLQVVAYSNNQGATAVNASTVSDTSDPVTANNVGNVSVQVGFAVEAIPTMNAYGLILLGLMLGLIGFVAVRRNS